MHLRGAEETDFDLLVELYENEIEPNESKARRFANALLHQMRTILAFKDQILCGTISWEVRGGLEDGVGEITALGVNESFRRQGIATLLVQKAISDATEVFEEHQAPLRVLYLFMEKGNEIARLFYSRMDFIEVTSIRSFYPHDDASIVVRYFQ